MKYTEEEIKKLGNIPISKIEQDIADTQKEIDQYQKELTVLNNDRIA